MKADARITAASLALAAAVVGCRPAPAPTGVAVPRAMQRTEAEHGVVAAAHPLAAAAGVEMLRGGGNAIDAAVATAFAVGVVEPMMAGIGGGGSAVAWLERDGRAEHIDFYAAAGRGAGWLPDTVPGQPEPPARLVAVPGAVAGLLELHEAHGALPRATVLAPAIALARDGFPVHAFLARIIRENEKKLTADSAAAALFYPGGRPLDPGERLVQPALGAALERIARGGRAGFYQGETAANIVAALSPGGSAMTLDDIAGYAPRRRPPLCGTFAGYTILSAPPPLGGAEVLQALALLDRADLSRLGPPASSGAALALLVDALRIARADRVQWIGFPDDVGVPAVGLASAAYANERRAHMGGRASDTLLAGDPWDEERSAPAARCAALDVQGPTRLAAPRADSRARPSTPEPPPEEEQQTTHISVIDRHRNAVALTFTLGHYFGSGHYAAGAFLNDAVDNFGPTPANRQAPGRTPRSTISPTIVLEGDDARLVVGSPGGGYIPPAIVHTVLYTLTYGLDPWTAVSMPRVFPDVNSREVQVEEGIDPDALAVLRDRGYRPVPRPVTERGFGGVHVVLVRRDGTLVGAADPRREGAALGY